MGADRLRGVVVGVASIGLILVSALRLDWFVIDAGLIDLAPGVGIKLRECQNLVATTAYWASLGFALLVLAFTWVSLDGRIVSPGRTRAAVSLGLVALLATIVQAYLVVPSMPWAGQGLGLPEVRTTLAPIAMLTGHVCGIVAAYYAAGGGRDDFAGEYKPIVRPDTVAAESGRPPKKIIGEPALARSATPVPPIAYAASTAEVTIAGIDTRLRGGEERLVLWHDVIGIVVRRLPPVHDGATFIDLVSTAGATVRLVRGTRFTGQRVADDPRALAVQLIAWCPRATLDPASRAFVDGGADAAQLPDLATLAAHDEKLA